ncbi:MAG: ArdC-like ssDNA-binding domain-containing protein [Acidobacteriota bacterium]|nr:ArdC-like ssDNA-binding domain-containing protein [Acidobacteriota bacterium]
MTKTTEAPTFSQLFATIVEQPGIIHEAFSRFHNYSLGNQILAWFQCTQRGITPGPIATYSAWQGMGRQVRKGEKALVLCQPVTVKKKAEEPEGQEAAFTLFTYRAKWFALAQTEGASYEAALPATWSKTQALAALDVTEVPFAHTDGNCHGYAIGRSVAVSDIAPMPFAVLAHELAHVVLGHTSEGQCSDTTDRTPRALREVEAESVAMLVVGSLGESGLEYCRGYVQHWLKGGTIPERSIQKIFKAADTILRAGRQEPEQLQEAA